MNTAGVADTAGVWDYIESFRRRGLRQFTFKHTYVANARSVKRLMVRKGWCGGTRSSRSTNANMLACGFRRPRILATSTAQDASAVPGPPTCPE